MDVYKDGERGRDGGSEGKLNERSGGCIWALENEEISTGAPDVSITQYWAPKIKTLKATQPVIRGLWQWHW